MPTGRLWALAGAWRLYIHSIASPIADVQCDDDKEGHTGRLAMRHFTVSHVHTMPSDGELLAACSNSELHWCASCRTGLALSFHGFLVKPISMRCIPKIDRRASGFVMQWSTADRKEPDAGHVAVEIFIRRPIPFVHGKAAQPPGPELHAARLRPLL